MIKSRILKTVKDLVTDNRYQLKITSKKLKSGRFQVKFYATIKKRKELYGYLLVEPGESLREVVVKIRERLAVLEHSIEHRHFHLYNIGYTVPDDSRFLIFE